MDGRETSAFLRWGDVVVLARIATFRHGAVGSIGGLELGGGGLVEVGVPVVGVLLLLWCS
jgi:hypothetical protein